MNNNITDRLWDYVGDVQVAFVRAGPIGAFVALCFAMFPFSVATLLNPSDAAGANYRLMGRQVPHIFTASELRGGFAEALFVLAALALLQCVLTVLFYRRSHLNGPRVAMPPLWPIAATIGVFGNGIWFLCLGYMDIAGFVFGMTSAALSVGIEMLCENLGRGFVQGSAAAGWHPPVPTNW